MIAVDAPARRGVRVLWRLIAVVVVVHLFFIGDLGPWRAWSIAGKGGEREIGWNPADTAAAMRWAETRMSAGLNDRNDYAAVRAAAERAVRLSPRDGELLRRLARVEVAAVGVLPLDRSGRERIARMYRDSAALQRTNPFVPSELAAFLLDAADPAGARRAAERALEIEPEAVAPRLLLARAILETGDPDRALELIRELESLAGRHAAEARTSAYARDLLTIDPTLVRQLRARIESARQPRSTDPRFGLEDQEDKAGSSRPVD